MHKNPVGVALACLLVALGTGFAAAPASAQSFLDKLMDFVSVAPAPSEQPREPVPSLKSFARTSPYGGDYSPADPGYAPPDTAPASYRTLCVRMCDGYYWPISANVTRGRLYRDADVCRSSCDSETRLFFLPRGSDDVEHMTDISGRVYGRLPEAFAYRKTLVAGCTCRPEPWSETEVGRHRAYAEIEAAKARGEIPAAVADARIDSIGARANREARIETGAVPDAGARRTASRAQATADGGWVSSSSTSTFTPTLPPRPSRREGSDFDFFNWW